MACPTPIRLQPREPKTSAAPAEPRAARAKAPKAAKPPKVVDANAPLSKTMLFVGGLPETIGTDELKAKFEKFGELSDAFGALRHLRPSIPVDTATPPASRPSATRFDTRKGTKRQTSLLPLLTVCSVVCVLRRGRFAVAAHCNALQQSVAKLTMPQRSGLQ